MNSFKKIFFVTSLLLFIMQWSGCKKFVQVEAPTSSVNQQNVYQSDATAIAVLTSLYASMVNDGSFSGSNSISLRAGLSADEFTLAGAVSDEKLIAYYRNKLRTNPNENYGTDIWGVGSGTGLYYYVFICNAAVEGLNNSQVLTPSVKKQLLGEAKFMRAFFYFYLVNFYGDVPLVLSTNAAVSSVLPRSSNQEVYKQIVADLKEAQQSLGDSYLDGMLKAYSERVRPTQWAATALLARVYLYITEYANAEAEANKIIANSSLFSLAALNNVFLRNSTEAIWQLQPVQTNRNTEDAFTFILPPTGPNQNVNPVYLSQQQLAAFETNDKRRKGSNWVDSVLVSGKIYFYPSKYKATVTSGTVTEYLMMFRLAEQFLIRAEARAMQNNFEGAKDDLNLIRRRAGLGDTNANDQPSLLTAILKERQAELFTELGQRWLDLKRTDNINGVMSWVTPLKGGTWNANWQLYPIPFGDIQKNPNLKQNPGY
jgi:hypothetical protein